METLFLETTAGKIAYIDSKTPGPCVILIHGNSCTSKVFTKQFERFASKYRMIAIDLPGHGDSDPAKNPESIYCIPGYAQILEEVVRALNIQQFSVVGYSLGGNIALQWTQISKNIKKIMLVSSAPLIYSKKAFLAYTPFQGNYSAWPKQLNAEQATDYMKKLGFDTDECRFMVEGAMKTDGRARALKMSSILAGKGVDETEIIQKLSLPLAVVVGSEDHVVNLDYLTHLSFRNLWNNKIHQIPNANHSMLYHQADQLNSLLEQFLKD